MEAARNEKNCILIVDNDRDTRALLKRIFVPQYMLEEAESAREGLALVEAHENRLCALILDLQMPETSGMALLEVLAARGVTERVPTFLITSQADDATVTAAYELGVMDVMRKPLSALVVQKRVGAVVELFSAREALSATVRGQALLLSENAREMDALNRSTIEALATAIEFRDIESGQHVSRIYGMTTHILRHTAFGEGLTDREIDSIARGAILHDVGKIAISDVILNKPGKLTREEFEVMKQHTVKGALLLEQIYTIQENDVYRHACDIARHHHERWDGKGYPDGLSGEQISVAAQVVSIVDVYDALVSERVYKKAYTPEVAVRMIRDGECGCFNPRLLECFLEAEPAIRAWYTADKAGALPYAEGELRPGQSVHDGIALGDASANSVMDVMMLMSAVQTAYDMIISVNLTRNTYRMVDYDRFGTHCADFDGRFDDLIDSGTSSVPISHRKEFHDTFCRESLFRAFAEGKKTVQLEHPQYGDDGAVHWVSTRVLFMEDSRTGELRQITLARYIDKERVAQEQTRKILADVLKFAEHANRSILELLAEISHNLYKQLDAIIAKSAALAENPSSREKQQEYLAEIGISARCLQGIVQRIFGSPETGSAAPVDGCGVTSLPALYARYGEQLRCIRADETAKAADMMQQLEPLLETMLAALRASLAGEQ